MEVTMKLTNVDEVLRYIGGAFESAFADPAVGPGLAASRLLVRFGLIDPDCVLVIDAEHRQVRLATGGDSGTTALMAMNADLAHDYCQGRLDLSAAVARGDVAVDGDVQQLLELVADRESLPRMYADLLRREGRADLLAA
jgi:hypothetical protein